MRRMTMRWIAALAAATGLCATAPAAWAGPYLESGGQVVMEAENADANIARGGKTWTRNTAQSGFSGGGYMIPLPDETATIDTNYTATSPELQFNVRFSTTGTYYIWIRGAGGSNDTAHAGIDGTGPASADKLSGYTTRWTWKSATLDTDRPTVTVSTTGVHTIHLWMREDGFKADKILLRTSSSTTTPSGTGPAESPRSNDTTPPEISNVSAGNITASGATISWTTNEGSTTQVNYGTTTSYGQSTTLNTSLVTSHSASLSGLTASTLYHYRVRSKDAAGNERLSTDAAFTTTAAADTTPPSGTLTINSGAVSTKALAVTLTLSATDNSGLVSQMQFSNDGTAYSTPEAYATTKAWTLSTRDGTKTVLAKFKDAAGNWSSAVRDTITLDTVAPTITITSPSDGAIITP